MGKGNQVEARQGTMRGCVRLKLYGSFFVREFPFYFNLHFKSHHDIKVDAGPSVLAALHARSPISPVWQSVSGGSALAFPTVMPGFSPCVVATGSQRFTYPLVCNSTAVRIAFPQTSSASRLIQNHLFAPFNSASNIMAQFLNLFFSSCFFSWCCFP